MNPANPKLSSTAASVACGFGDLYRDGTLLPFRGQYPGWFSPVVLGYLDPDGYLTSESGGRVFAVPFNTVALGGSRWIGVNTAQQTAYVWTGEVVSDAYCPAISPEGQHWACLLGNNALDHPVLIDGIEVTRGVIDDKLSITADGTLVYSIFESGLQQTWGKRPGLPPERLRCTYQAYEVDPVAVQLPDGAIWVVSHDDSRTLVRPWGSTLGYLLPGAKTPHAMAVDQTHLRVVGDLETSLLDRVVDLTLPRTALNIDPNEPPIILPPIPTIPQWAPQTGRAPLTVQVTVTLSGGPCDLLRIGASNSGVEISVPNPTPTTVRPLTLTAPGTYTLHAEAYGPGGTRSTEVTNAVTVTPAEEPMPPVQPYPSEPDWWLAVVKPDLLADYAEANKPLDDNYPVWFSRTAYDIRGGMTKEDSWFKHRNEERAANGLPPL